MRRALAILLLGAGGAALAHGDLHDRIEAATRAIEAAPESGERVLRRAELYRMHADWEPALADYARASALGASEAAVALGRGTVLAELGRLEAALAALDRAIELAPESDDAHVRRARARQRAALPIGEDYDRAIALAQRARPDLYVERARAEVAQGRIEAALAGLEQGVRQLGPIASLVSTAFAIERDAGRHEAALARLDSLLVAAPRKETLLVERGELLRAAGREDAARLSFEAALEAITALPQHLRITPAVRALEARLSPDRRTASSSP